MKENRTMNFNSNFSAIFLTFIFIIGCSSNPKVKQSSENSIQSKDTKRLGSSAKTSKGRTLASLEAPKSGQEVLNLAEEGLNRSIPHVANELIIQFRSDSSEADKRRARSKITGSHKETLVHGKKNGDDLELVHFKGSSKIENIIQSVLTDPSVEFAEPNWIVKHMAVSNDPYYLNNSLWGVYSDSTVPANAFGTGAAKAWETDPNCGDVVVGIIDEGYMYMHPDLAANAFKNPGEIAGNGIDDDSNGYVDDVQGWNFDGKNNTVFGGSNDDHGTHVAGTIGAVGGNGIGTAGMCWSVKILNAKFLGSRGGTTANAIKAVDYFTDLKVRHNLNLVATNNSWGGGGFSQGLSDAIERAEQADILFIAAAGNNGSNNDSTPSYPSNYLHDNVIAVAAIASNGSLASYSNYGLNTVDIGAPGSGIWSTIPKTVKGKVTPSYANYNGTSMATPHVTGAAARYKARYPSSTFSQIKAALLDGLPLQSLQGKVMTGDRLSVLTY